MKNLKLRPCTLLFTFLILLSYEISFAKAKGVVVKDVKLSLFSKIGKNVFNHPGTPVHGYNVLTSDESAVYIYDSKGKLPFYCLDLKTLNLKGFGAWGEGPAEIPMGFPVIISQSKGNLFVYPPFELRILAFKKENLASTRKRNFQNSS